MSLTEKQQTTNMGAPTQRETEMIPLHERGAFKIPEACKYLGVVAPVTIRRLIARGLIKPIKALRHILISKSELDRFLAIH
jgi:excisionase family DNA binding protein